MIYRPGETERLWDSWLYEWGGTVHLFYLASQEDEGRVGHCTSTDLVRWRRHEDLVLSHWPLTGMVLRHEGRFLMPLGEVVDGVQTTTFYVSDDLFAWRRLPPDEYRLGPRAPHYATQPAPLRPTVWWRDPFVFRHEADGHYHAIVCAAWPQFGPDDTGAVLAHVRTRDFRRWEHLPPLDAPTGLFYHNEVPDLFVHEGRWYVLFSTGSVMGLRLNTPSRRETTGTYYMVADALEGPYRLPQEPLLVGAGLGAMSAYVARAFLFGGEWLLYHQVRDGSGPGFWSATWGTPKRLHVGSEGELSARYWPGLEALETGELAPDAGPERPGWERHGNAWRGRAKAVGVACPVVADATDVHLRTEVTPLAGGRCGLVLRASEDRGVLVALDMERGRVEIGMVRHHELVGWGSCRTGFLPDTAPSQERAPTDTCAWPLRPGRPYVLRCLARAEHFEVYLDDRWVFTAVIPEAPSAGQVDLYVERGEARFGQIRVARLEPLKRSRRVGEARAQE